MNPLLRLPAAHIPPFIKKRQVRKLIRLAADAFGAPPPPIDGMSFDECLKVFATFTNHEAEEALRFGMDLGALHHGLYDRAFTLGAQYRRWLRVRKTDDVMAAARMLYACCGIDFQGTTDGDVTIRRCFFSNYYSSAVCSVISSLDAGLLAGLSGGRRLTFSRRITEGAPACIGRLNEGEPE